MRLYANHCNVFIEDCERNQIAEKLRGSFKSFYGHEPNNRERQSWQNSLRALAVVLSRAGLTNQGILLEYQLPMTSKRADCILCGYNADGKASVLVIELKQWEMCKQANGQNEVLAFVAGAEREVLHPSEQVRRYAQHLADNHLAFHAAENPIQVAACAYLHNYFDVIDDPLTNDRFSTLVAENPVFIGDDVDAFVAYVRQHVGYGDGLEILAEVEASQYRPSKKLMHHVAQIIQNEPEYVLLDEQQVAFDGVLTAARSRVHDRKKQVIIIKGGPGTGKSVIALNLAASLLAESYATHYVTGSKAFTETLRNVIGPRGSALFTYSNSYMRAAPDSVDILVTDEAHRIRDVSSNRFTKKEHLSGLKQIEELINAARVCVFLIDDDQIVRPGEIGSVAYIRKYADLLGCRTTEYELEAQFRCNGSDRFVRWISRTLGIHAKGPERWEWPEEFDFRVVDSPEELQAAIEAKIADGATARVMAGFCWPWSAPKKDGTLVNDVVLGTYQRPWNAKPEAGKLAAGIPKSNLWAHDPGGIHQVGCVYTAQGFEFDYAGVIFGDDLRYDCKENFWIADKTQSFDTTVKRSGDELAKYLKNTYRVLLSRGIKGCFVYFTDKSTAAYFRSKVALPKVDCGTGLFGS